MIFHAKKQTVSQRLTNSTDEKMFRADGKLQRTTSPPSKTISSQPVQSPYETLNVELGNNEQLYWWGQPNPRALAVKGLPAFLFGIPWTAFALFWTAMASMGVSQTKIWLMYAFPLFGVPFILIGFAMLLSPLIEYFRASHTIYAVTNQRAIDLCVKPYKMESYAVSEIRRVQKLKLGQFGSVMFAERKDSDGDLVRYGFHGVEDVDAVAELIRLKLMDD